jgi:4-hydroxy-tetrahydrodipicolinate synthase
MAIRSYGKAEAKAAAKELLRGIIPGPTLPIDEHGGIDEQGYRHNVRYCIDVIGSTALYINSYYQHFWLLTGAQRRRIFEIAVEEAGGRVPLINRVAHPSPHEAIELAKHAQDAGADFISLVLPQFGGQRDVLFGYFTMIADEIDLGISVFNTQQAGYSLSPETFAELAEIPNVCSLKNGMPLEHTARIRDLVGDSVVVVDPDEENALDNLKAGQQAIFTSTNTMFDTAAAQPMRTYFEAGLDGRLADAERLFHEMQPLRDLHHRWVLEPWHNDGLCPVATVKFWQGELGMVGGPAPAPLPQLSKQDMDDLRAELVSHGLASG